MVRHRIDIQDSSVSFYCDESQSVLAAMEAASRKGIPVGCRNGGCGVCKVEVLSGSFVARVMSREHVSIEDEAAGRVLSCRIRPASDLRLRVLGRMKLT
jgi:ferredoxin